MADVLNGWEKQDKTVGCMKTGDMKCISETLSTVQEQKVFMNYLGTKAEAAGLPGLLIVDTDKDGYTDVVKVTAGKNKMTISLADGKLSVADDNPTIGKTVDKAADYVLDLWKSAKQKAGEAFDATALGKAHKDAGTTNSLQNQRWQAQERQQGI